MGKFDEIFDDVVVNAKAAAAVVSKKASTVYDTSKHKITAAEIRGEINKKLRDIGKYTYKKEVFGVDTSAEVAQLIAPAPAPAAQEAPEAAAEVVEEAVETAAETAEEAAE